MRKQKRLEENFGAADVFLSEDEYEGLEKALAWILIYGKRTDEDIAKLHRMAEV